ncbi:MAG: hypothetical protein ACON3Z_00750 [Bradymonadia bacterium]
MLRRLCIIPLLMQACVLESETCGEPFTAAEGRCVVIQSQPNAQDGGMSDGLVFAMDAERQVPIDDGVRMVERPDAGGELADFVQLLLVDSTPLSVARRTPPLPGADIDGVQIVDDSGAVIGTAVEVLDEQLNDPFQASIQTDSRATLFAPDGRAASLGTEGGFVRLRLEIERPVSALDGVEITEIGESEFDEDQYDAYLCREDSVRLDNCVFLGTGQTGPTYLGFMAID